MNIIIWGLLPSLLGGEKLWYKDGRVVQHSGSKTTVAGYSLSSSCLHIYLSFKVSMWLWYLHAAVTSKQELFYQPKLHQQLMCYRLKRLSKTLICIYTTNVGSRWTGCVALAAEVHCYLHSQKKAREAGGHVRNLLYNACTSCYRHFNLVQKRSVQ